MTQSPKYIALDLVELKLLSDWCKGKEGQLITCPSHKTLSDAVQLIERLVAALEDCREYCEAMDAFEHVELIDNALNPQQEGEK